MADHVADQNTDDTNTDVNPDADETTSTDDDYDAQLLAEAKAEAEGKTTGEDESEADGGDEGDADADKAKAETGDKPADGEGDKAKTEKTEKKDGGDGQATPMIPKGRFDEVLSKVSRLEQQNAYLAGQVQTLTQQRGTAANDNADQDQGPTIDEQIAELRQQKRGLAKKYDDGEIGSTAEWEEQRDALDDQIFELRQQKSREEAEAGRQQTTRQTAADPADDLTLDRLTDELVTEHPFMANGVITEPADQEFIKDIALRNLRNRGVELKNNARSTYALRKEIGVVSDRYGPEITGKTREELLGTKGDGQKTDQQQPSQTEPSKSGGMSDTAKARAAKLDMAEGHPPNINQTGGSGTKDEITEEDIMRMSDDEIAALPEQTRRRILEL